MGQLLGRPILHTKEILFRDPLLCLCVQFSKLKSRKKAFTSLCLCKHCSLKKCHVPLPPLCPCTDQGPSVRSKELLLLTLLQLLQSCHILVHFLFRLYLFEQLSFPGVSNYQQEKCSFLYHLIMTLQCLARSIYGMGSIPFSCLKS